MAQNKHAAGSFTHQMLDIHKTVLRKAHNLKQQPQTALLSWGTMAWICCIQTLGCTRAALKAGRKPARPFKYGHLTYIAKCKAPMQDKLI